MNTDAERGDALADDYDVVVVGGGPAGCSVGVFTARHGLETAIFDRGRSSIRRCAHLENYLGFPAGIDIETFYGLIHDHAEAAGCEIVSDLVESVDRRGDEVSDADHGAGFIVETQEGRRVSARRVVAATRYDAEYLRGLDDDDRLFEVHEHGDEEHEHFDTEYPDRDGTTPVDGLFVASPSTVDYQALAAAGRGARVGIALVEDVRRDRGYPEPVANYYDWVRREAELEDEADVRRNWRAYFDDRLPDDHDLDEECLEALRTREIDRRFDQYIDHAEADRRAERGQKRLLEHVDDDLILEAAREITAERDVEDGE